MYYNPIVIDFKQHILSAFIKAYEQLSMVQQKDLHTECCNQDGTAAAPAAEMEKLAIVANKYPCSSFISLSIFALSFCSL